ncbi:unnamed protein product [Echinostoma caproni]|uniref:DHC_N1 domain-containing protein n=1 Tax=Echinostoma caproni TaxID=27848 RepID=A0A183AUJ4_9TREM|nr:unnamed protein product [Echinostoma caproni]
MASDLDLDDKRVEFVADYVLKSNKIKGDKWMKLWNNEEAKQIIFNFFDKPDISQLFIVMNAAGLLQAQLECPSGVKSKSCFFMKKEKCMIKKDSPVNKLLIYGDLPQNPLEHFSAFVDEVLLPLVSNKRNYVSWPDVVYEDVVKHAHGLKRQTDIIVGQAKGKTLLPLLVDSEKTKDHVKEGKITRSLVYAIESLVIAWSHQIHKALLKDSAQPLLNGLNPNPLVELDFWKAKATNLENIYDQLNAPKARQMAQILESANSSYFVPFKEMFKSVVVALREAQDIHNHLAILRPYLEDMEQAELEQLRTHFEPVMHLLCLIWADSPGYRQPGRILIILQELCNLIIDQCRVYLDPTDVLKAEPEEAINKVNLTLSVLHAFKTCYEEHRAKLHEYFAKVKDESGQPIEPVLWEFKTELAFGRYDAFTERVQFVQHLMNTSLEFLKLEKVVFGGLVGNSLNIRLKEINESYVEKYKSNLPGAHADGLCDIIFNGLNNPNPSTGGTNLKRSGHIDLTTRAKQKTED